MLSIKTSPFLYATFCTILVVWIHPPFKITGGVIAKKRYKWEHRDWKAAVTSHTIRDRSGKIVDGSQCCQICREKYPETKVWQKYKLYSECKCSTFDDNFDPSKYEKKHGAYSIGSCE